MNLKSLLFVFFLVCGRSTLAQKPTTADSLKKILQLHKQQDTLRAEVALNYVNALFYVKPDTSLMAYADEALWISQKLGWQKGVALSLRTKGVIYLMMHSDAVRGLEYYQKALKANETWKDKKFEYQTLNNIGGLYRYTEDYKKSLLSYQKALAILKTLTDKKGQEQLFTNVGSAYYDLNDYVKAEIYLSKGIIVAQRESNFPVLGNALSSLGLVMVAKREYQRAITYLKKADTIADSLNYQTIKVLTTINLAMAYKGLKQYNEAEKHALSGLALTSKINLVESRQQAWETLAEVYQEKQEFKKSLDAYRNYVLLHDSLITDQKKSEIARKEERFEQEKRKAVLNAQHSYELQQQETVRNGIIGGVIMLVLASGISFLFYKWKRDADEQARTDRYSAEMANTELKVLRSQINPHFIANSLNSISDYILHKDPFVADRYLTKFAHLMRSILTNSDQGEIPLAEDINTLELYLQLESLRLNHRFTYQIDVDPALDPQRTMIPPLLLQPFVENSIWHGLAPKIMGGLLTIQIYRVDVMMVCTVTDNGIGREKALEAQQRQPGRKSHGIAITKARIDILSRLKKADGFITLSDLNEGTKVAVTLPLTIK